MTNLILSVIGILLAAGAALIVMNYGGDYFDQSADAGQAATVESAMQDVLAAYRSHQMRAMEEPANLSSLISTFDEDRILPSTPLFSAEGSFANEWSSVTVNGMTRPAVNVTGIESDVCRLLSSRNGGPQDGSIPSEPIGEMGCFSSSSGFTAYLTL